MVERVITNHFLPCKETALKLNEDMHNALCISFEHMRESCDDLRNDANYIAAIQRFKKSRNLPPELFGRYYDLAFKLLDNKTVAVENEIKAIAEICISDIDDLQVYSINHPDISHVQKLFLSRLGESEGFTFSTPVTPNKNYSGTLKEVFGLIRQIIPELYDEMRVLLRYIILVGSPAAGQNFDGAAVYQLWRLLFINEQRFKDRISLLEALVHEEAHIFLFGNTVKTALTLNCPSEQFYSAIRDEKRPIDGIYHAMIVNARLVWALTIMKNKQKKISLAEKERIESSIVQHKKLYIEHRKVILEHASLSDIGKNIFKDADACVGHL